MKAEILCVGTEILLGDIVNTNAAFLARELAACGIGCYYQTVVGDNPARLKQCLEQALARTDIVITTGGLGPTYDDLTKETVAAHFGRSMELHEPSLPQITDFFRRAGQNMTENNRKQAYMPQGAKVFDNDRGTAPGLALEGDTAEGTGKIAIMMPGPPREMTAMFERHVRPYLLGLSDSTLVSHAVHMFGIGESRLENELRGYMEAQSNPTVAPYAKEGEVMLRVTASAPTREEADALIRPEIELICKRYEEFVYGVDVDSLQNALVQTLLKQSLSVAVAEIGSGGAVAQRICEVAGSENVLACGICPVGPGMTEKLLGIPAAQLAQHPAASEETAMLMARAVRELSGADIGCAVTELAVSAVDGNGQGRRQGIVYMAVSSPGQESAASRQLAASLDQNLKYFRHITASKLLHMALLAAKASEQAAR